MTVTDHIYILIEFLDHQRATLVVNTLVFTAHPKDAIAGRAYTSLVRSKEPEEVFETQRLGGCQVHFIC